MDNSREALLRGRISRLEKSIRYYDAALNTARLDEDRKRLAALESALADVLCSHPKDDPAMVLTKLGISAARGAEILILLNQKFAP
jgi:hypothetical protein